MIVFDPLVIPFDFGAWSVIKGVVGISREDVVFLLVRKCDDVKVSVWA